MKIQVLYFSKTGNTKKIAEGIAEELSCSVGSIEEEITEEIDVLFLGASLYNFGIDKKTIEFINTLDQSKVKRVALFSTSWLLESGVTKMRELLKARGIEVMDKDFYCKGKFLLANRGRPNAEDVLDVKKFARDIIHEIK